MAAQKFTLYNKAIKKLGAGTIALPGAVRIGLFQSASNFATKTISLYGSLTSQVASGNGYTAAAGPARALAGEAWTAGASAGQYKFNATNPIWTGTGGAINNIKACVLFMSGATAARHVLAYASLTSSQFNLSQGNTLTIQFNASGVFTAANG